MKEWQRTVILFVILGCLVGLFIWLRTGFEQQALDTLR
jgi:hypothetical protein